MEAKVAQAMLAFSKKFKGVRPKSKMVRTGFRNAGLKNYMDRVHSLPAAQQSAYTVGAAQFNGGKPIVVRHREYLQPIIAVTAFTGAGRYIIQPGLVDNFPWLGQIAGAFENYLVTDIKYVYRTRCGANTNAIIYTATQYDVTDAEFGSVTELMTYAGARSEIAWSDFAVGCNLRRGRMMKKYLTRTDALAAGQDAQLYDQGLFTICGVGATAGTYLGDLLVEYTVHLWNPKQNPNLIGAYGVDSKYNVASGTVWAATPFLGYNAAKTNFFSDSTAPIVDESKSTITFPEPGTYDVAYHLHGPGGTQVSNILFTNTDGKSIMGEMAAISDAGGGLVAWIKLAVNIAGAVLTATAAIPSGTPSASPVTCYLVIAVEAASLVLDFLSKSPSLEVSDVQLNGLKQRYPKRDLSAFIEHNKRWHRQPSSFSRGVEVDPYSRVEVVSEDESDERHRKRSKSSERKRRQD